MNFYGAVRLLAGRFSLLDGKDGWMNADGWDWLFEHRFGEEMSDDDSVAIVNTAEEQH